ncbi:MAG: DUF5054 domain-containing protein [Eubacteriales bacterium]|nr:DUF5054 domain-containing protein [Eubacteriales bacterium]
MIKKIILVFKTHFDIGFTDLASNVIRQYSTTMLSQVLDTCRATEDMGKLKYVWTMPAWPLKVVTEQCSGELKGELEHYIRNGQIAWHALPFTSHTDFCGEEEYLESLRYGKWLSEKYEKPYPIAAKMTDVPGHGMMLPEILCASGIRFLHLGCNAFATPPEVPDLFFWQAKSGRRLLTMYCRGGYGSGLEPPAGWEFPVWMALIHTHDNCGPQSAEFIRELVEEAKELYPEAEIVCGTMDDFVRELEKCGLSRVPVVDADLADTWIHGVGAYPGACQSIRSVRHESTRMQKYYAQLGKKLLPAQEEALNKYYENMHLFGEHTWGADVKTWLGPERVYRKKDFLKAKKQDNYQFMEKSWEEQRERAVLCGEQLSKYCFWTEKGQEKSYLYNPSVQPYTGWVPMKFSDKVPLIQGKPIKTATFFEKTWGYVQGLLPLSTEPLEKGESIPKEPELSIKQAGENACVENHRYCLIFEEKTGVIVSLTDKKYDRVLLKAHHGIGVFSYQYTRHGIQKMTEFLRNYGYRFSDWGVKDYGRENYPECEDETYVPEFLGLEIKGSTICFSYQNEKSAELYGDAKQVMVEVTLPPEGEELFVRLLLKDKQETPFIESGSFCIPFPEENPQYRINKNGVLLDPAKDIIDKANHVFYALENFAAARKESVGTVVMAMDTPLLSIGDDGCYQYRKKYEENLPVFFFNTFNNMWGTNFPQWQGGDASYRFVIRGYEEREEESLMEQCALHAEGVETVPLPVSSSGLKLPKGMELMNLKQDEKGLILVARDLSGMEGREVLEVPGYRIYETDYYGRAVGDPCEDRVGFQRKKYGLHLFRAEKNKE